MTISVKICGLTDAPAMNAAIEAGARFVGLVFQASSPRYLAFEKARALAADVPPAVTTVGLFVDPSDDDLRQSLNQVALGMIQLHGRETAERVAAVKALTGLPVMKAVGIATSDDLAAVVGYETVADWLLLDAKPGRAATRAGGNAQSFDWSLIRGRSFRKPWMLAGGLTAGNVAEAIRISGARAVDVSSSVEDRLGHKDPDMIREFIRQAQA